MLTGKENFLRTLRGECPEWVPMYGIDPIPGVEMESVVLWPDVTAKYRNDFGGLDPWGVEFVATEETAGGCIPKPGQFILDDITKWRDVIKAPDLSGYDWEYVCKKEFERFPVDREKTALGFALHNGYFQNLMAFMGFEEGMMAMYEEPEEVMALFEYICDFYCTVIENMIDIIKPDVLTLIDDTAAWGNPFISSDMYREMVLPFHDRQAKFGRDRGLPMTMHNCGKCGDLVEDWLKIGVNGWDPAQTCNDLAAIKEKYGNKMVLMGGWDARDHLLSPDVTEEEIRQSVRDSMDKYAPGGGYMFMGGFLGPASDKEIARKNAILLDEVNKYGHAFYKK
jgi:hypothetical protein